MTRSPREEVGTVSLFVEGSRSFLQLHQDERNRDGERRSRKKSNWGSAQKAGSGRDDSVVPDRMAVENWEEPGLARIPMGQGRRSHSLHRIQAYQAAYRSCTVPCATQGHVSPETTRFGYSGLTGPIIPLPGMAIGIPRRKYVVVIGSLL